MWKVCLQLHNLRPAAYEESTMSGTETEAGADGGPKPAADGDTGGEPTWGVHEVCSLFPEMSDEEFAGLKAHIAEHGQQELIVMHEGKVIDGRHRLKACRELGLAPKIMAWNGRGSLVAFVVGKNLHRRNLTPGQRAAIAAEALDALEAEARQRQQAAGGDKRSAAAKAARAGKAGRAATTGEGDGSVVAKSPQAVGAKPAPKSRDVAAAQFGVSGRGVQDAKAVLDRAPELHAQVKAGTKKGSQARRELADRERRAAMKAKAEKAEAAARAAGAVGPERQVVCGDSREELLRVERGSARLVFADPPYNIGVDYGGGRRDDELPDADYKCLLADIFVQCYDILTDDGSLWLLVNHENAAALEAILTGGGEGEARLGDGRKFVVRDWITWLEGFGVARTKGFSRTSRRLLHLVKDPKEFVFHPEAVNRLSDRQTKYNDKRADPNGKIWDDVWGVNPLIPRVAGTHRERLPGFPTQLPLRLLWSVVGCASDPGDLIVDPFSGSATTGVAAVRLGRRYLGVEKNPEYAELSRHRLAGLRPDRETGAPGPFEVSPETGEPEPAA
jgi:site-specific DNA-methyltransferase (adenine-specific)